MDHYLDIRVLPDPEFSEETLMAALFAKLHRALGARGKGDIGISFPRHALKPGAVLRLHGTQPSLEELEQMAWRRGLSDYCQCGNIIPVPDAPGWRCVRRLQVKSSPQRLLRRSVKKGRLSEEEAQQKLLLTHEKHTDLPWVSMRSLSTGQSFRLFIHHGDIVDSAVTGEFSSYGLSQTATIPWF